MRTNLFMAFAAALIISFVAYGEGGASPYNQATPATAITKQPMTTTSDSSAAAVAAATVKPEESRMWMTVGERRFAITLDDNEAARAFAAMAPLGLDMAELNGNEKHAELPKPLPAKASSPGTIRNGDLMLYGSRTIVLFYLTFDSSYSYTRLGRVDDPAGLAQALGRQGARVKFSKD
jgi:hypothetical protein